MMTPTRWRAWRASALVPALLSMFLSACGGNDDEDARLRLLNATSDMESLDLYTDSDRRVSDVGIDTLSDYASFEEGSFDIRLKNGTDGTTLASTSQTLAKEKHSTAVAWGSNGAVNLKMLEDEGDGPGSGLSHLRVFNATTDAGSLDVYLTSANATLDNATANAGTVTGGSVSNYGEVSSGTYRLRVTAAGDKDDLRLDVPSITLGDQQRVSLVLRQGSGGMLVHALALVQQGGLIMARNPHARARLAAGISNNGVVSATIGDTSLSKGMTSPGVGNYQLIRAGDQTMQVQVNGATASSATTSITAGADYTVLAHGTSAVTLLNDDNRLPSNTARAKMRLVHGVQGHESLSLALNAVSVASDVPYGTASAWANVLTNADGNAILEVTSPLSNSPLYTTERTSGTSGLNISARGVYTAFMLGGNSEPKGILRQER